MLQRTGQKAAKIDSETSISYECDILIWDHLRDYNRRSGAPSLANLPLPTTSLTIKIDIIAFNFQIILSQDWYTNENLP